MVKIDSFLWFFVIVCCVNLRDHFDWARRLATPLDLCDFRHLISESLRSALVSSSILLFSHSSSDIEIPANSSETVKTGIAIELPHGARARIVASSFPMKNVGVQGKQIDQIRLPNLLIACNLLITIVKNHQPTSNLSLLPPHRCYFGQWWLRQHSCDDPKR